MATTSPQFVGRERELAELDRALAAVQAGNGAVVVIGGESGIGKSRLVGELITRALDDGAAALIGECLPLDGGERELAPVLEALRPILGVDEDGARGPEPLLRRVLELATSQAVLLVIEDVQWSDSATRDFIAQLVRAGRRDRILLVVTYRTEAVALGHPTRLFLLELERQRGALRLTPEPFTRAEVRQQVTAILGAPPEPGLVDRLLLAAQGNPLLTEELLAYGGGGGKPLPERLRDALLIRVRARSPELQTILRVAAVADGEVEHALLQECCRLDPATLTAALREAIDARLLTAADNTTTYGFVQSLLRQAIYQDMLPIERRELHLQLAQLLVRGGRPKPTPAPPRLAARLARQWHGAQRFVEAFTASIAAAAEAEQAHAFSEALDHYERALSVWTEASARVGALSPTPLEINRLAAQAAYMGGDTDRAVQLTRRAMADLRRSDTHQAAELHERLGRYLLTAGRGQEALIEYRRGVELVPADPPTLARATALAAEGTALATCSRHAESAERCREALAIARQFNAEAIEARALATMCLNYTAMGMPDNAIASAEVALRIAEQLHLDELIGHCYVNGADALDQAGRVAEAIVRAQEGIDRSEQLGTTGHLGEFMRIEIASRLMRTGAWDEAGDVLDDLLSRNLVGQAAGAGNLYRSLFCSARGDLDGAARALALARQQVGGAGGSGWGGVIAEAAASLELAAGRPAAAIGIVEEALPQFDGLEWLFYTAALYAIGVQALAELALDVPAAAGHRDALGQRADALIERIDGVIAAIPGTAPPRAIGYRLTAIAERSRMDLAGDPAAWERAGAAWDEIGDAQQSAYCDFRRGEALLTGGRHRDAARRLVNSAHVTAGRLKLTPLVRRIEELARRGRLPLGVSDELAPERAAILDLTPRELEVLRALAAGLTNREIAAELFISDKTVSVHVSRILGKLAVPNRAAAAAAAHRMGVEPLDPTARQ